MKAVILAAGKGSRMKSTVPKPLIRLFGIPLIEYKIRRLKDFEIAVVYNDKKVAEYIKKKFPEVKLIYNPYPEKENGYSLYCAKEFLKENERFLLLMADHYYGEKFFRKINDVKEDNYLFVSNYCYDPQEATKVKVKDKYIVKIGKELSDYDYFDTGFFILNYQVFSYIESLLDKEKIKLSDVMQLLANEKKLFFKLIEDIWLDIDTKEELKKAEEIIRKSLIKDTDGIISKLFNRKLSTRLTKFLVRFDFITPNRFTVFSSIIGFLAGILFLSKNYVLAGILTQIASIIDGCDGEIARIKNLSSKFGAVLDSVLDRYVDTFILFAIFLSIEKNIYVYVALFLSITGSILISYVSHLTGIRPFFITRDIRLFLVMVFSILSAFWIYSMTMLLWILGIASHLGVIYTLLKYKHK